GNASLAHTSLVQKPQAFACMRYKLLHITELDGIGRTYFSAGRFQSIFHTVITEGAFMSSVVAVVITHNHPERAGDDAIATAIADILLYIHCVELRTDNRTCWAGFLTGSVST